MDGQGWSRIHSGPRMASGGHLAKNHFFKFSNIMFLIISVGLSGYQAFYRIEINLVVKKL